MKISARARLCPRLSWRFCAGWGIGLALVGGFASELCWHMHSPTAPKAKVAQPSAPSISLKPNSPSIGKPVAVAERLDGSVQCDAALLESDEGVRVTDLRTALLGWGRRDPSAALRWILNSASELRGVGFNALASVLAEEPAKALAFGETVFRDQPALAEEFGSVLIGELLRGGHFDVALELAAADPAPSNTSWMTRVLAEWAAKDPQVALDAERALSVEGASAEVFAAVAQGWAQSAPGQLADFALTLPRGPEREVALRYGIEQLTLRDPTAVATRVGSLTDPVDHDVAVSSYLAHTDALNRPTSTALALALAVSNPKLRVEALQRVVREWAASNPAGALAYVEHAPALGTGERDLLLHDFSSPPAD